MTIPTRRPLDRVTTLGEGEPVAPVEEQDDEEADEIGVRRAFGCVRGKSFVIIGAFNSVGRGDCVGLLGVGMQIPLPLVPVGDGEKVRNADVCFVESTGPGG
jgi:hypothetical protein